MTSTSNTTHSVEATTALLQAELPQLEEHQLSLQKELAEVSERLESVRGALSALSVLSATAVPQPRAAEQDSGTPAAADVPAPASPAVPEQAAPESAPEVSADEAAPAEPAAAPVRASRKTSAVVKKGKSKESSSRASTRRPAKKATTAKAAKAKPTRRAASAAAAQDANGLTDQVIAILSRRADTPLRARDVAQELGRDDSAGSINTVRSTLDRLVATSRAHRAGRGLYQAPAN